jgi:RNA 3'-terminal phosphate cyclase
VLTIDCARRGRRPDLRTSLSLSLVTGTPFRIQGIRVGAKRPGFSVSISLINSAAPDDGGLMKLIPEID